MNRWLVMEAFADRDGGPEIVKMQVLNIHASVTAAYVYWGKKGAEHRLFLVDLRKRRVFTWDTARRLMFYENLKRVDNRRRIPQEMYAVLIAAKLLTPAGRITNAGRETMAEFEPPPALQVALGFIPSGTRLHR